MHVHVHACVAWTSSVTACMCIRGQNISEYVYVYLLIFPSLFPELKRNDDDDDDPTSLGGVAIASIAVTQVSIE